MTRVEIELSSGEVRPLDSVIGAQGMKERQEAVARALQLLEWAVRERQSGRRVGSEGERNQQYRALLFADLAPEKDAAKSGTDGVPVAIGHKT